MMWYWGGGVHWWGWLLGAMAMVAFWGLVIWVIWYLFAGASRPPHQWRREPHDPKGILDERLARGEIDADDYRRLLAVLRGEPTAGAGGPPPVATGDRR